MMATDFQRSKIVSLLRERNTRFIEIEVIRAKRLSIEGMLTWPVAARFIELLSVQPVKRRA